MPRLKFTRRSWRARAVGATRRFLHYLQVVDAGWRQPKAWGLPLSDVHDLFTTGVGALRALKRADPAASREHIRELERVGDRLSSADNWIWRLGNELSSLKPARAQGALRRLVTFGCVPDALLYCLQLQLEEVSSSLINRTRLNTHRRRLRALARQFERLGNVCADYPKLALDAPGAYLLGANVAAFLWKEARGMKEFLDTSDPRRRHRRSRAEAVLFTTMQDIKTITGGYHDDLLATVLSPAVPTTGEALRRWRARAAATWASASTKGERRVPNNN
jgi:hypothetical protein